MNNIKKIVIGFMGTSGTGKSTIFNKLKEKYKDSNLIRFVEEGTKQACEKLKVNKPSEIKPEFQKEFQNIILNYYLDEINIFFKNKNEEILISDRTLFDHMYFTFIKRSIIDDDFKQRLQIIINNIIKEDLYTKIFYFSILEDINLKDGFRNGDKYLYIIEDFALRGIISNYKLNTIKVPLYNIEDRVLFIEQELNLK